MARAAHHGLPYKVEPGRIITFYGVKVITILSRSQTNEPGGLHPAEADQFAHEVAAILNRATGIRKV